MFRSILVPLDLADTDLAKPAIATAATLFFVPLMFTLIHGRTEQQQQEAA